MKYQYIIVQARPWTIKEYRLSITCIQAYVSVSYLTGWVIDMFSVQKALVFGPANLSTLVCLIFVSSVGMYNIAFINTDRESLLKVIHARV